MCLLTLRVVCADVFFPMAFADVLMVFGQKRSSMPDGELPIFMLSIAERLAERQKAFFMFGPRYRSEVTMGRVAEDLSLSVSTVSRAVKGSYVQCRWGVLPMRSLFSHSTIARPSADGDLRMVLRDIVANERSSHPLSDQKISEEFARRGVNLSRRTVARFRQELGIPSASERRYR